MDQFLSRTPHRNEHSKTHITIALDNGNLSSLLFDRTGGVNLGMKGDRAEGGTTS